MAFKNYYAEMELPTVIIDMPELQRLAARKKAWHAILYTLAALIFVGLAGLIYLELTTRPKEVVKAETLEVKDDASGSLKLTVKLAPQNVVGAVVEVDGEVISGNPPYVYLSPSEEYHSIKISAPGYEVMSKDVQVAVSEVMTFALIAKDAVMVADNSGDLDAVGDTEMLSDSDFGANSDDLIEEIQEDDDSQMRLQGPEKRRGKGRLAGQGANKAGAVSSRRGKAVEKDSSGAIRSVSVSFGPPAAQPAASAGTQGSATSPQPLASASGQTPSRITTVPAQPIASSGGAAGSGGAVASAAPRQAAKASLIVNAPLGITSRVRVSVDGQMRGYLPVLLKVDPGLHELTFMTEGRRTFQMVKLNPGQIVRIIPNL